MFGAEGLGRRVFCRLKMHTTQLFFWARSMRRHKANHGRPTSRPSVDPFRAVLGGVFQQIAAISLIDFPSKCSRLADLGPFAIETICPEASRENL